MKRLLFLLLALPLSLVWQTTDAQANPYVPCIIEPEGPQCSDDSVWNGYWWKNEVWVPFYPSIESWFQYPDDLTDPVFMEGNALFYGRGVMEATAHWRGLSLENYVDGIALMSPAYIGLPVWIWTEETGWMGPFLVVDSAARGDMYPQIKLYDEVAEFGWKTAIKLEMVDERRRVSEWKKRIKISTVPPWCLGDTEAVDYASWWLSNAKPADNFNMRTPVYRSPSTWKIDGKWVTFTRPSSPEPCPDLSRR